jgi:hypothetical protein
MVIELTNDDIALLNEVINVGVRDCNPRAIFSIPGFGIVVDGIPGSRNTIRVGKMGFKKT